MQSNVGNPQVYNDGDQRNPPAGSDAPHAFEAGQKNAHDLFDPKDNRTLQNRLKQEKKAERDSERAENAKTVTDPLEPAQRQGHEPSRGAQIDADLKREDEELMNKKDPYNGTSH
ncbi:hypothetical protein A0H81_11517 [Grifola frondosa]|uniref:Uncharacterized protein n=1 Tax=Grifola frondosa TaxID=5627 RepID=A0A1C7LWT8_GRIFR|nr:hypothetical protein A0H81_11517 [Grifola frondosa]